MKIKKITTYVVTSKSGEILKETKKKTEAEGYVYGIGNGSYFYAKSVEFVA